MHEPLGYNLLNTSCIKHIIILLLLLSSQLQFGFKPGLSTTMCTGVLKAVVSRYLHGGSNVYGCLIDASKAFDTVGVHGSARLM